jgi:hypothetical protein
MMMIAGIAYMCHRNGINPLNALMIANMMGGRGRRGGMGRMGRGMGGKVVTPKELLFHTILVYFVAFDTSLSLDSFICMILLTPLADYRRRKLLACYIIDCILKLIMVLYPKFSVHQQYK